MIALSSLGLLLITKAAESSCSVEWTLAYDEYLCRTSFLSSTRTRCFTSCGRHIFIEIVLSLTPWHVTTKLICRFVIILKWPFYCTVIKFYCWGWNELQPTSPILCCYFLFLSCSSLRNCCDSNFSCHGPYTFSGAKTLSYLPLSGEPMARI